MARTVGDPWLCGERESQTGRNYGELKIPVFFTASIDCMRRTVSYGTEAARRSFVIHLHTGCLAR